MPKLQRGSLSAAKRNALLEDIVSELEQANRAVTESAIGQRLRGQYHPAPLTRRELATFLDVSLRTVDKYVRERRITYIRLGGLIRFRLGDVEKALRRYTIEEVKLS